MRISHLYGYIQMYLFKRSYGGRVTKFFAIRVKILLKNKEVKCLPRKYIEMASRRYGQVDDV